VVSNGRDAQSPAKRRSDVPELPQSSGRVGREEAAEAHAPDAKLPGPGFVDRNTEVTQRGQRAQVVLAAREGR